MLCWFGEETGESCFADQEILLNVKHGRIYSTTMLKCILLMMPGSGYLKENIKRDLV